jgi:hypothetical protein
LISPCDFVGKTSKLPITKSQGEIKGKISKLPITKSQGEIKGKTSKLPIYIIILITR